jgi:hypothetical protein
MNSKIFSISKEQMVKVGVKFLLVLLAGVVTFLQSTIPGLFAESIKDPIVLTIMLAVNTALIDFLRKYISDEEGKLGGFKIN